MVNKIKSYALPALLGIAIFVIGGVSYRAVTYAWMDHRMVIGDTEIRLTESKVDLTPGFGFRSIPPYSNLSTEPEAGLIAVAMHTDRARSVTFYHDSMGMRPTEKLTLYERRSVSPFGEKVLDYKAVAEISRYRGDKVYCQLYFIGGGHAGYTVSANVEPLDDQSFKLDVQELVHGDELSYSLKMNHKTLQSSLLTN